MDSGKITLLLALNLLWSLSAESFAKTVKSDIIGQEKTLISNGAEQKLLSKGVVCELLTTPATGDMATIGQSLTDGEWKYSKWGHSGTACWNLQAGFSALILFDLNQIQPIEGIRIAAVKGKDWWNSPYFPNLEVFAGQSLDKLYKVSVYGPDVSDKYSGPTRVEWFGVDKIKFHARYVMLSLSEPKEQKANRYHCAITEIEILKGKFDAAGIELTGESVDLEQYVRENSYVLYIPRPDTTVVTAHTDWVSNDIRGKPKVLFVVPDITIRDPIELIQRINVDFELFSTGVTERSKIGDYLWTGRFLKMLDKNWDVIALCSVDWSKLRPTVKKAITDKVEKGMALLYVNPHGQDSLLAQLLSSTKKSDRQLLFSDIKNTELPYLDWVRSGAGLQTGKFGIGRVAIINFDATNAVIKKESPEKTNAWWGEAGCSLFPPPKNYYIVRKDTLPWWEPYYALLSNVLMWTAYGDSSARIRDVQTLVVDRDVVRLRVFLEGNVAGLKLEAECIGPFAELVDVSSAPVERMEQGGIATVELAAQFTTGKHLVYLRARDTQQRDVTWASALIDVPGPEIHITTEKNRYEKGDWVRGNIQLTNHFTGSNDRVEIELVDTFGRVVAHAETSATEIVPFKLPSEDVQSLTARVVVRLYVKNRLEASNYTVIPIARIMPEDDYQVGFWASYGYIACARPWAYTMLKKQSEFGGDFGYMAHATDEIYMQTYAEHNLWPVGESILRVHYKKNNLCDPNFWNKLDVAIKTKGKNCYKWGAFDFSSADEHMYGSFPKRDELSLAKFRKFVKANYKDINDLNAQWSTLFKSWDEVTPEVKFDPSVNIASRLQFELFSDQLFIDFLKVSREKLEELDSRNRVGMTGTRDPGHYVGYDWWKIMKETTHLAFYDGLQRECIRSFKKPGDFITSFVGFDFFSLDERNSRYFPWLELFSGFNGVSYYSASSSVLHGYVSHDLTNPLRAKWAKEELTELKSGVGRAILTAKRDSSPIAIHFSQRNLYADRHARSWADASWPPTGAGTYRKNLTGFSEIIKDLGLQFDFVADEQVENGILQNRNYKVMILPLALVLSDTEAQNIAHFVRQGGRLIVAGAAGVYNEHGKVRSGGRLDELLGIKTQTPPTMAYLEYLLNDGKNIPVDSRDRVPKNLPPVRLFGTELSVVPCDSTVSCVGAETISVFSDLNKTLAVARRKAGDGQAVFLNFLLTDYRKFTSGGVGGEITTRDSAEKRVMQAYRRVFAELLEGTAIASPVSIYGQDGKIKADVEQVVYRRGSLTYLCVLPRYYGGRYTKEIKRRLVQPEDSEPVKIHFKDSKYVYDVRAGKSLGKTQVIETDITEGIAELYALTPYEIKGLKLTCPEVVSKGQELTIKVGVDVEEETQLGDHIVHLSLVAPSGISSECYKINLLTQAGKGVWKPKMALNETTGIWYVEAKDVISGKTARVPFHVTEGSTVARKLNSASNANKW